MKSAVASIALLAAMAAPSAVAQTAWSPPAVGTVLEYAVAEPGFDAYTFRSEVVVTGADFMITRDVAEDGTPGEDFFVEFAGMFLISCLDALPTTEDRAALLALWPPAPGESVTVTAGEFTGAVLVGQSAEGKLPDGKMSQGHSVTVRYSGPDEPFTEVLLLTPDLGTPLISMSSFGTISALARLTPPAGEPLLLSADWNLQNCWNLL